MTENKTDDAAAKSSFTTGDKVRLGIFAYSLIGVILGFWCDTRIQLAVLNTRMAAVEKSLGPQPPVPVANK